MLPQINCENRGKKAFVVIRFYMIFFFALSFPLQYDIARHCTFDLTSENIFWSVSPLDSSVAYSTSVDLTLAAENFFGCQISARSRSHYSINYYTSFNVTKSNELAKQVHVHKNTTLPKLGWATLKHHMLKISNCDVVIFKCNLR